jgi:hypothetical protein
MYVSKHTPFILLSNLTLSLSSTFGVTKYWNAGGGGDFEIVASPGTTEEEKARFAVLEKRLEKIRDGILYRYFKLLLAAHNVCSLMYTYVCDTLD